MIPAILQVIFPLCAEKDQEDAEVTNHKFASQMVDILALKLPTEHFYKPAMEFVHLYSQDSNPEKRRAAITAMAVPKICC